MTGAGCEKRIDPDYDLHFYDAPHGQPAHAQQSVPFPLKSSGFSLSVWVRYDVNAKSAAPFLTLYHSQVELQRICKMVLAESEDQ